MRAMTQASPGRPYVRMNGAGNDFIVVQAFDAAFRPEAEAVRALCDRASPTGGCDQLIVLEPAPDADAFMRVWNADGSSVETCGNALRCVGWLMMEALGRDEVRIDTAGGPTTARRISGRVGSGDPEGSTTAAQIQVDMGKPRLDWTEVPLAEEMDTRGIELQVGPIDDPVIHTPGAVSMGNPHVVFFMDHAPNDAFVRGSGSLIEHHPLFPEGVNVGFAHIEAPDRIRLRVWERGAGLTKACGTGACAALVAAARRGKADLSADVVVDGGVLRIDWDETTGHVLMTGPVEVEGTGILPL